MILTDLIGEPAILEQLAEEAAELNHASLKLARILRGENPTPVRRKVAVEHLTEEMTDIFVCIAVLAQAGYEIDPELAEQKIRRWYTRVLRERGAGE